MLRLDKLPEIPSGNKFFKLKYNIKAAIEAKKTGLLTFGGAYSNHILATAQAAKANNLKSIGIIRGEKPSILSPTLQDVVKLGMQLHFVSRTEYRQKKELAYLEKLQAKFPEFYIIPEGGTNNLAIKGTSEIRDLITFNFDYIASSIGTGGTIAGINNSVNDEQQVLGFSSLKGNFMIEEVNDLIDQFTERKKYPKIFTNYHCGGYAKVPDYLLEFIVDFYEKHKIPLEPIYTAKMMLGLFDLIEKDYFPENKTIVAIHTGGLQGLRGFSELKHLLLEE